LQKQLGCKKVISKPSFTLIVYKGFDEAAGDRKGRYRLSCGIVRRDREIQDEKLKEVQRGEQPQGT
jgi:hypothetical protein